MQPQFLRGLAPNAQQSMMQAIDDEGLLSTRQGSLEQLALLRPNGDTRVRLPYSGNDEIGRIAQELAATRALRERVRRRQERLLRTKLQALAQATHQSIDFAAGHSDEEQLRQLAAVMNELSGRLIDQHQRLTGMVQELREALITKNRLAGLEQELQIAAQVQLSILPRQAPRDARVQLHCHITPAQFIAEPTRCVKVLPTAMPACSCSPVSSCFCTPMASPKPLTPMGRNTVTRACSTACRPRWPRPIMRPSTSPPECWPMCTPLSAVHPRPTISPAWHCGIWVIKNRSCLHLINKGFKGFYL